MALGGLSFTSEEFKFQIDPTSFEPMRMLFGDEEEEKDEKEEGKKEKDQDDPIEKSNESEADFHLVNSHILIEEMMITANTIAASFTTFYFPHHALLRSHPSPNSKNIREFISVLSKYGIFVKEEEEEEEEEGRSRFLTNEQCFSLLVTRLLKQTKECLSEEVNIAFEDVLRKNLQRAQYTCTGDYLNNDDPNQLSDRIVKRYVEKKMNTSVGSEDEDENNIRGVVKDGDIPPPSTHVLEWKHDALSLPLYTHFTSPIRRY
jgi:hypothetical protein